MILRTFLAVGGIQGVLVGVLGFLPGGRTMSLEEAWSLVGGDTLNTCCAANPDCAHGVDTCDPGDPPDEGTCVEHATFWTDPSGNDNACTDFEFGKTCVESQNNHVCAYHGSCMWKDDTQTCVPKTSNMTTVVSPDVCGDNCP